VQVRIALAVREILPSFVGLTARRSDLTVGAWLACVPWMKSREIGVCRNAVGVMRSGEIRT